MGRHSARRLALGDAEILAARRWAWASARVHREDADRLCAQALPRRQARSADERERAGRCEVGARRSRGEAHQTMGSKEAPRRNRAAQTEKAREVLWTTCWTYQRSFGASRQRHRPKRRAGGARGLGKSHTPRTAINAWGCGRRHALGTKTGSAQNGSG